MALVVIGATGGVGTALTRRLAASGRAVYAIGRSADKLAALSVEVPGLRTAVADVTDHHALTTAIQATPGSVEGLAYCVGSIVLKSLKSATAADFIDTFQLNALGAVVAVQAAERALKQAGGSVVLFSTVAVHQGFGNHTVVAAAKGAVEGLMLAMAAELAPKVRVNCIAPSLTDTTMAKPLTDNGPMATAIAGMHPIPRLGTADDQASLAAFLLGPDAGWITGQVFGVDGGRSTLRPKG
jgi:NAD(P)-dependent dehydrogenase (short-subunit alcohol dehydrogenase family)